MSSRQLHSSMSRDYDIHPIRTGKSNITSSPCRYMTIAATHMSVYAKW